MLIHDLLAGGNWQRAGKKNATRPKPMSPLAKKPGQRYGRTDRSPDEVKALLARFGPQPAQASQPTPSPSGSRP